MYLSSKITMQFILLQKILYKKRETQYKIFFRNKLSTCLGSIISYFYKEN